MRRSVLLALLAALVVAATRLTLSQEAATGGQSGVQQQTPYQNMTPEQRAEATRAFLGLGAVPDKAAAARGEPLFKQNCAYCHGRQARGATAPSLITSDVVLSDDHGEHLVPFLERGRPEKDMPSFAATPENQLRDIAEFLHLEVERVANRGTYQVLNILVGNVAKGQIYVAAHCMSCHTQANFAHIAKKFRSAEQLQRGWIWPTRASDALAVTARVKTSDGVAVSGRVTQISDFRITLIDPSGRTHVVDRNPGVDVEIHDPLAPHQQMLMTLRNNDMHNVTAYLRTLE
jgi:cytochrome c oxidase cbb3-type subunit III